jgi:hypothetical protein
VNARDTHLGIHILFPLIKLAKKLKGTTKKLPNHHRKTFPLIKLAKKLKAGTNRPNQGNFSLGFH